MTNFVILMLACGLVTWIPRIVPFLFSKKLVFPKPFTIFLSYLPLCILGGIVGSKFADLSRRAISHLESQRNCCLYPSIVGGVLYKRFDEDRYHRRYCYGTAAFLFLATGSFYEEGENR